ncbi:hypothetical protein GOBAR_DD15064 [Gossypium barbadense]|nr:hypothetical protein GOBAR_DD15064 [Gossypium barbadense]
MKVVDDEDVETMVALYCGNGSDKNAPIHLFAELADIDVVGGEEEGGSDHWGEEVDSDGDLDVDDVPDDIDDEDVNNDGNINTSSVKEQMRCILIHNNLGPYMSLIDLDAAYVAVFLEYPEIVHPHGLAVNSDYDELFIGQRFSYKEECVFAIKRYEVKPRIFRQRMIRIESDIEGQTNTSFRQWLGTTESWQWAQSFDEGFRYGQMTINLVEGINAVLLKICHLPIVSVFSATFYRLATLMPRIGQQQVDQMEAGYVFVEHVKDAMVANHRMARSYGIDLRNRRCECRRFDTLHYPCAHVVAACAKVNLNVEQYVDDVYMLERILRVWENEFPILPDLSTWEVPPTTFELLPDRGLRRNPRGRPQLSRIRNEMDIREKSDGKRCGLCRLSGHSQNKCPHRNFYVG